MRTVTPGTASKIADHYGTRFGNVFCSSSSLEIKVSCVSGHTVGARSPLLQPGFFCSKLTVRLIAILHVVPNSSRAECWKTLVFFLPSVLDIKVNSIHNSEGSSHSFFWKYDSYRILLFPVVIISCDDFESTFRKHSWLHNFFYKT